MEAFNALSFREKHFFNSPCMHLFIQKQIWTGSFERNNHILKKQKLESQTSHPFLKLTIKLYILLYIILFYFKFPPKPIDLYNHAIVQSSYQLFNPSNCALSYGIQDNKNVSFDIYLLCNINSTFPLY